MPDSECRWCPWECGVDRAEGSQRVGRCGAGAAIRVARVALHHWEEPCISGDRGSGAVFFSHCNLHCIFCQNHEVSQGGLGREVTVRGLADEFLHLQQLGAHNVNLVSGSHYVVPIRAALEMAKEEGLRVPVVWNSGGYDSVRGLEMLEGLVDVFLPDLKYSNDSLAEEYSGARHYWRTATLAVREMLRQVGPTAFSGAGLVTKGLIIRHLVLPGHLEQTKDVLDWIRVTMPRGVHISVMSQYFPAHLAVGHHTLGRTLTHDEYAEIADYLELIGLVDGWVQDLASASDEYVPAFEGGVGPSVRK